MPRSTTTKTFSITLTPEQHAVFQTITGDRSALMRGLIRDHLAAQGVTFPLDAEAPIVTARKTRWTNKQDDQ